MWLKILNQSCSDVLDIPDESCDIAVFSPPYKESDGYSAALMYGLGRNLDRIMKPGSRIFMNFGQLKESFSRPFDAQVMLSRYFIPGQTIIWSKSIAVNGVQHGHYQPINSDYVFNYCFEYIFTYSKGEPKPLDRLSIGVPFKDKANLSRDTRGKHGDVHCAGDIWHEPPENPEDLLWFIPYETTGAGKKKQHKYEYPEKLVERCLKVSGVKPGDVLFEPFLGSGTSAVVAKKFGLNVYATEIDQDTINVAQERWNKC